ncbi:MAG: ATP-binding cassette domain-containing protein [Acidimicrobiaceae bacterium]|nr:ATP-binding cassette domain-containing protein [Acidimicrobiaceae bacterium]MYH97238.1 ATP-binding cassette domain-containing protein [Acidimicrobiia bacterium]MDE0664473.1 ATP-binding cassette domain-containing protein [Acidimicrobiaceae bacterium]MXY09062.1 ATP-binding cassette domain-containing protein [Acidimicrobiaceae bacterium]MXZ66193.1 ATP-binding cassette domain-containing protein [Acidimicrobiaceae bacterium]
MTVPSGPAPAAVPAVRCRSLGVSFGAVRALHDVSLDLAPGRIHALVGQNGAGKTTLVKVLGGLQAPDSGEVHIAGRKLPSGDARAARAAGLAMVHQHFSLPPSFTVAEALELTAFRPGGRSVYRRAELRRRWRTAAAEIGGEAVLSTRIRDLPVETRQSLEIVRALATDARVVILDEPTALLTPTAIDTLFERLRRLRDDGVTVLVVLHKLREVAAAADTVSVLRDGELVLGPSEMSELSQGQLSDAIVGPASGADRAVGVEAAANGERQTLLELVRVSSRESAFEPGLRRIDLSVDTSEIVGIAGVEGNGQRSLVSVIAGLDAVVEGSMVLGGTEMTSAPSARRRLRGLRLVPFDRNSEGISRRAPVWLNQSALRLIGRHPRRFPLISLRQYKRQAAEAMDHWQVRYDSVTQPAESLSGGNVQRLILSREMAPGLEVLVAAQPTRGLDFAATNFVRRSLRGLRDAGAGVLLVSSDLDELFELSDRLLVMYGGSIVARFEAPYDRRAVGDAMTGALR